MKTITAINTIRDSLRTNLTDPYTLVSANTGGGTDRGGEYWIFADEPHTGNKYPKIEIKKVDNPTIPISIGPNYTEQEELFLNIWYYSKNGFKFTVSGTEYINSQAVEYYLSEIKETLKDQFSTLYSAGIQYKHINTTPVEYDPDTQMHYAAVTIQLRYYNDVGCGS